MANRSYNQAQYTAERAPVSLYGTIAIGAAGAVGAVKGYGISAVVKEATAGQYSIVLEDKFQRALSVNAQVTHDSISGVLAIQVLEIPANVHVAVVGGTGFKIQCIDAAGSAVNPEEDAQLSIQVVVTNSSVDLGKGV
jgi:hypothetical protein